MTLTAVGPLQKMVSSLDEHGLVKYQLPIGDQRVDLNALIGQELILNFSGAINCQECGKKTKKSYSQGFCFPCMQKLAQCDMCMMKPETCHFHVGTCREPEWGESHCFIPHYVYLANTSGLKVGITRNLPTRWIDQGATQALPIFKVKSRLVSGLVETALAQHIADKTNWRAMLKGGADDIDLAAKAEELLPLIANELADIQLNHGEDAFERLNEETLHIEFPVSEYLTKISSFNFDKTEQVSGILLGIKGQYLIFEKGVINIRKFTSYHISAEY